MTQPTDDTVREAPYCVVCRCSSTIPWRKHIFSKRHDQCAHQFLQLQVTRIQTLCNAVTSHSMDWWRCVFCDSAVPLADALAHCSTKVHRKQVERFCRHHRCDGDHHLRRQLWLPPTRLQELEQEAQSQSITDQPGQNPSCNQGTNGTGEHVEAFLSSAASRLHAVQAESCNGVEKTHTQIPQEEQQDVLGPLTRRCKKTVTSSDGVMQNPLGRHEGKRVWGGGIVKVRKTEWLPWTIDHLVQQEQANQEIGTDIGTTYTHRLTELALGQGLSSIAPVSWGASVGNVHTAAVPPWMVETEEEYKKCNRRVKKTPECSQDWLPNFGGVWQEGPRSKTKQAFRKARKKATATSDDRDSTQSIKAIPRLPVQVSALGPKPIVQDLPSPPQPASYGSDIIVPQQEPPLLRSCETIGDKSTLDTPLDAKKQLLLAQKERLRAKLAAKRRQQ